jgi:hypothetical protein
VICGDIFQHQDSISDRRFYLGDTIPVARLAPAEKSRDDVKIPEEIEYTHTGKDFARVERLSHDQGLGGQ